MHETERDSGEFSVGPVDTVAYIFELSGQLAAMADAHDFSKLAAALELARGAAAEALAEMTVRSHSAARNAATEDAA